MKKLDDVARGYAESLYGIAQVADAVEVLEDEMFEVGKAISSNYQLSEFLADKSVSADTKKKAIADILSPSASALLKHQINTLIDLNKGDMLVQVAQEYVKVVSEEKNRVLAEVYSVVTLTPELISKLSSYLGKVTGKNITVKNVVDESIVGGLIIKIEGKIIDLSLKKKLDGLRTQLRASVS